ncbi:MAG: PAAR domain-containing protein [Halomonas sp.]|uniref:PAAR domain-containing protein n=1 Tax=Halomonas sp. TaxID=1486246 RepID=UPI003F8F18A0
MKPVARQGDLHSCPIQGHGTTEIVTGSPSKVAGQPVARVRDKTGCGATIIEGSSHSNNNAKLAAT